ncbi:RNA polymerase sigma factor [Rubinisphaera margarita]|uniref:RNA polymerase sigma factor n=1 Tax=Rubinisphaera margarita TaxID=2909586 RepID=UPI001EE95356|nr:sigma-70 family RNA polymerase sigma factor [Rubinisphaera margarita]MCG6156781.1 sigma-70 family RNA polymerase sigma factor [Rubinisphaera margarita]
MIRLQGGDNSAFEELVELHQRPLIGYFMRNVRDWQLAEDLSQETLLRVYNQAWDYLPVGRFKPWMYRVARNLLIDNVRKRSHDALVRAYQSRSEDNDAGISRIAGEFTSPEDKLDEREFCNIVDRLLDDIPDDQRQTFVLHHYVGLNLAEVAEILEANVATTKSRLRLAREKLQEKLRPFGIQPSQDSASV